MTNQEAIKILSELHDQCCQADSIFCTDTTGARCEAVDIAISALEKQIPKKLQNLHRFRGREKCVGTCPTCGYVCCSDYGDYCGGCGQAIDWEGE